MNDVLIHLHTFAQTNFGRTRRKVTGRLLAEHLGESPGPAPRPPGVRMAAKRDSSVGVESGPTRGPITLAGLLLSKAPSPRRSVSRVPPKVLPWCLFCPGGLAGSCSPLAALRWPRALPVPPPLPQPVLSPGGEPPSFTRRAAHASYRRTSLYCNPFHCTSQTLRFLQIEGL